MRRVSGLLLPLSLLAGCDGATPTPTPSPTAPAANVAPVFGNSAVAGIEVVENVTGVIYQAAATDANNDTLTYSITGGEDAARFTIASDGKLSFVAPPDFENPQNAALNNDYQLRITANDGRGGTAVLALRVRVTNSTEGIFTRKIADLFVAPVAVLPDSPGSIWVTIAERGGGVTGLNLGNNFAPAGQAPNQNQYGYRQPKIGVAGTPPAHDRAGLLGMTKGTGDFTGYWFTLTATASGDLVVRQYLGGSGLWSSFVGTVITISSPQLTTAAPAPGGWIGFGPDGYLYIATGDGAGLIKNSPAQDTRSLRGKVLRIKPKIDQINPLAPQYTIPADNPFADGVNGAPEVWAYGFRNPRTGNFVGADLIVSDSDVDGQYSELNLIRPTDKGGNYGWPFFTGARPASSTQPGTFIDPVIQWARHEGNSPTAGLLYDGPITSLQGQYLFADAETGLFWTLPYAQIAQGRTITVDVLSRRNNDIVPDAGQLTNPVYLSRANNGDVYVLDGRSGTLFRLAAN